MPCARVRTPGGTHGACTAQVHTAAEMVHWPRGQRAGFPLQWRITPPFPSTFMIVLGVESSCDETGLALYDTQRGLLSHALYSQVAMHEQYGGVVPELASRDHIRRALPLLEETLRSE